MILWKLIFVFGMSMKLILFHVFIQFLYYNFLKSFIKNQLNRIYVALFLDSPLRFYGLSIFT